MVQKKSVSDRIRQRNKEKKIQRESVNQDVISEPAYVAETDSDDDNSEEPSDRSILEKSEISGNFVNKIHNFHDQNIDKSIEDNQLDCNLSKNDSSGDDDFTVPSEQVVERDLMQQLSLPSTSIDTEIPLTPPVIDKKQQFSVTAECIVYMFRKAVRSGYEEILHWYGFAESYDKRINEIRTINKVKINTAKQQVYQEVKKLLPDISDVNLHYVLSKVIADDHQNPKNNQVNASEAQEQSLGSVENSPPIPPASQVSHVPIKISKFPEDRNIIYEAVHKRFPFLSWTKSITWCRDAFEYTDPEAKCPACKSVHTHRGIWGDWTCQDKNNFYYLACPWDIYENKKVKIATQG
ncbi:unnamed protein product [Rhizophagus irregularis]|uniref:Uncharacterized protein n=1 Tax=Rhizophagus irregularis TaxID=588596 RepID=A0A915Z045_9GLOM|nr:unnamed protein product [Rhizophagus irregularis]